MLKRLRSEHHQNGLVRDFQHFVPVFGCQQQALIRRIEDEMLLFGAGMVGDEATSFQTNHGLFHMLALSGGFEMIAAIHVKNTFDFERDYTLDHRQASACVREGFQID